ncbi:hypothetical protein DF16_orf02871 [Bacillus thuringiensis serovar kurstaki str. YBT-1520]|nr:hypothetical protein DF16_orf02871 [Bacillus thuringiensis serovar kurstaki str. YBT-1520]
MIVRGYKVVKNNMIVLGYKVVKNNMIVRGYNFVACAVIAALVVVLV